MLFYATSVKLTPRPPNRQGPKCPACYGTTHRSNVQYSPPKDKRLLQKIEVPQIVVWYFRTISHRRNLLIFVKVRTLSGVRKITEDLPGLSTVPSGDGSEFGVRSARRVSAGGVWLFG